MNDLSRALAGRRVLDLSRLLPGPYVTMVLADMGADVVKVEDPSVGDYLRAIPPVEQGVSKRFVALNRGKRSMILNLKSDAGRDAFLRMATQADVVVESFRPGVMDRLGVGASVLRAANPGLVVCSISGYGQSGPYRERAGHDLNYVALAGLLSLNGAAGGPPVPPALQIADLAGGAQWAVTGILGALLQRAATGEGAHLDISMTEGTLALMGPAFSAYETQPALERGRTLLTGGRANYGVYETADGEYLSVGALEPKFWQALNEALGRNGSAKELISDSHDELRDELAEIFGGATLAHWVDVFRDKDCCVEPVPALQDVSQHPLHRARDVFFSVAQTTCVRTPLAPVSGDTAPSHGEHTREVLAEYGFTDAEASALG